MTPVGAGRSRDNDRCRHHRHTAALRYSRHMHHSGSDYHTCRQQQHTAATTHNRPSRVNARVVHHCTSRAHTASQVHAQQPATKWLAAAMRSTVTNATQTTRQHTGGSRALTSMPHRSRAACSCSAAPHPATQHDAVRMPTSSIQPHRKHTSSTRPRHTRATPRSLLHHSNEGMDQCSHSQRPCTAHTTRQLISTDTHSQRCIDGPAR